jgi:hypothetical protein
MSRYPLSAASVRISNRARGLAGSSGAAVVALTLAMIAALTLSAPARGRRPLGRRVAAEARSGPGGATGGAAKAWRRLPVAFEPTRGQGNRAESFLAHGAGYAVLLTPQGAAWRFAASQPVPTLRQQLAREHRPTPDGLRRALANVQHRAPPGETVLDMKIVGARPRGELSGSEKLESRSNYFLGNDPRGWRRQVPEYARVNEPEVYPGIDLVYYGHQDRMEYDFVISPGADPAAILVTLEAQESGSPSGLSRVRRPQFQIGANGDLMTAVNGGEVRFLKPVAYQPGPRGTKRYVEVAYRIERRNAKGSGPQSTVHFNVAPYDRSLPLVIDPSLAYSTYLGGSDSDGGLSMAVDASGDAYVTGYTLSTDFPTAAAFQDANGGGMDAFVAKLKPDGSGLIYSTYLGGSGDEDAGYFTTYGGAIAVDASGSAYVTGYTDSVNFPVQGPLAGGNALRGPSDGFVAKLSTDGSALVYSTYLGGSDLDYASGIVVDASGSASVVGSAFSTDFPVTSNAYQKGNFAAGVGGSNAFVAQLNPAGSSLTYSTYLGGSLIDAGLALAADSSGDLYATGETYSVNFPTTQGAYNRMGETSDGTSDGWLTKLDPSKSGIQSLVYSTYFGGSNCDAGMGVAVDASGAAYVAGATMSMDYPATTFQKTFQGGTWDGFLTKFEPDGSGLAYSTYLGGSGDDMGNAVALDAAGAASVVGTTASTNFPVLNAFQSKFGGGTTDAFYAKLNPDGSALILSTYLGGAGNEDGYGVALDSTGGSYISGDTQSTNFPITPGAFQTANTGAYDAFITKLAADFSISAATSSATVSPGSAASYSLTVAPAGGFDGTVSLACSGLPAESSCSFSPSSVTLDGFDSSAVTLSITTTAPSALTPQPRIPLAPDPLSPGLNSQLVLLACLALAVAAAGLGTRAPKIWEVDQLTWRLTWRPFGAALGAALLAAALSPACGGGGSAGGGGGGGGNPGTAAGSYTVNVTATSGTSLSHTLTLMLTVN